MHVKQEVFKTGRKGVVVFHLSGNPEVRLTGARVETGVIEPIRQACTAVVCCQYGVVLNVQNLLLAVPVSRVGNQFGPKRFGGDMDFVTSVFVMATVSGDEDEDEEVDHHHCHH